jgi:uncharacterized protein (TIRG00374 family)
LSERSILILYMSFRSWLSVITFVLIAVILFFSRHELVDAFHSLEHVNLWILALLIPVQILSYYGVGEMVFEYLRSKGAMKKVPRTTLVRMALEMNFVNHVLPSGGVSGVSYMNWRLGLFGVSAGRATMAQVVRYAMGFASFIVLLLIAVLLVTIDGNVNRWIILVSSMLVTGMVGAVVGGIYLVNSERRLTKFSTWLVALINKIVAFVTFKKVTNVLKSEAVTVFFTDLHRDFMELKHDKKILIKPFLWGIVYTIADLSLFLITFWALGQVVNPAPVLIAYGVASMAGFFVVTPGGAGAYEALMVAFLAIAGIIPGIALAGIVLCRVIVLLGTVVLGYVSYQHAILKYGKGHSPIQRQ